MLESTSTTKRSVTPSTCVCLKCWGTLCTTWKVKTASTYSSAKSHAVLAINSLACCLSPATVVCEGSARLCAGTVQQQSVRAAARASWVHRVVSGAEPPKTSLPGKCCLCGSDGVDCQRWARWSIVTLTAVVGISGMLDAALPNNLPGASFQEQRIYAWNYQRSCSQKHPVKSSLLTCPCSSVACRYEAANQKWEVPC